MSQQFSFDSTATQVATAFADRIKGRTVLVTGVSPQGLGSETVRAIASAGPALIIIASRTRSKVDEVVASVQKEAPNVSFRFVELDLASLESARKAGQEVLSFQEPLHVVINNAAVMGPYRTTKDGFESNFGTNHLGHFVFTNTLLPKLIETAKADPSYKPRIVVVSSRGHKMSSIRWDDLDFSQGKEYEKFTAYGQSKTANILYGVALAERLAKNGILVYSLHPGIIVTDLGRSLDREELVLIGFLDKDGNPQQEVERGGKIQKFKSLAQGASTHVFAAFSPDIEAHSGAYLADTQLSPPDGIAEYATNKENADKLWELSEKLVGEKYAF